MHFTAYGHTHTHSNPFLRGFHLVLCLSLCFLLGTHGSGHLSMSRYLNEFSMDGLLCHLLNDCRDSPHWAPVLSVCCRNLPYRLTYGNDLEASGPTHHPFIQVHRPSCILCRKLQHFSCHASHPSTFLFLLGPSDWPTVHLSKRSIDNWLGAFPTIYERQVVVGRIQHTHPCLTQGFLWILMMA